MFLWHITGDTYCHSFRAVKTTCPDWTDCALVGSPGGGFWKQAGQVLRTCFRRTARKRWRAQCHLPVEVGCRVLTLPGVKRPHRNTAIRTAKEAADGASRWIKWGNLRLNVRTWSIPGWVANPNHPRNLGKITDDACQDASFIYICITVYWPKCWLTSLSRQQKQADACWKLKFVTFVFKSQRTLSVWTNFHGNSLKYSWELYIYFLKIRKLWYRLSNCKVSSYHCSSAGRSW